LRFTGSSAAAMVRLRQVVVSRGKGRMVQTDDRYFSAAFTSRILAFVDEVEVALYPGAGLIDMPSTSRLVWSNFGVDRNRLQAVRAGSPAPPDLRHRRHGPRVRTGVATGAEAG
jgi:uncharacterized protein (DUF1499 family)